MEIEIIYNNYYTNDISNIYIDSLQIIDITNFDKILFLNSLMTNNATINFIFGQTTFYDVIINVLATKSVLFINNSTITLDSNYNNNNCNEYEIFLQTNLKCNFNHDNSKSSICTKYIIITPNSNTNCEYYDCNNKLFEIMNLSSLTVIIFKRYSSKHTTLILIIILK